MKQRKAQMASVNKAIVMGNLGKDPVLRYTQSGKPVAGFSLATKEFINENTAQGPGRKEMTEWHNVVVWGAQAEACQKYLTKGQGVYVEGRLATRKWKDNSGQERFTTEIVAHNVQFLPKSGGQNQGPAAPPPVEDDSLNDVPF